MGQRIVGAFPVNAPFVDNERCDAIPNQTLKHELGGPLFPIDELISWSVQPGFSTCNLPDDGGFGDWIVEITNLSKRAWTDLFFVADSPNIFGNNEKWSFQRLVFCL